MTENTWRRCSSVHVMLSYVHFSVLSPQSSRRKLRLFACACCRRVWSRLTPRNREAVELAERFADGKAKAKEVQAAHQALRGSANAIRAVHHTCAPNVDFWSSVKLAAMFSQLVAGQAALRRGQTDVNPGAHREHAEQIKLLREMVGNPFRPVAIDPAWRKWHDATIVRLAQRIYDERRFADLPMLADALEEAGCTNADILNHCRGPGPHVRGCWVVDLLLGKE